MGTSIGAAIDYLVAGVNPVTSTTLAADLVAAVPDAVLVDNFPLTQSESMVFIGRVDPDDAQANNGSQIPLTLGGGTRDEDYEIPCYITTSRPGPQQKPARDAAIALFDALAHWVATDPTLGGILHGGRYAHISNISLVQTRDSEDAGKAGALRIAWIKFDIHAQNHYTP